VDNDDFELRKEVLKLRRHNQELEISRTAYIKNITKKHRLSASVGTIGQDITDFQEHQPI
jgi:hypothetical protein